METLQARSGSAPKTNDLFSGRVQSGPRTISMVVREVDDGRRMMSICESRTTAEGLQRQRILLSADQADEFVRCFREALRALKTGHYTTCE